MKNNLFNSVKLTKPKRSQFDLSHDVKLSLNMGKLVPTLCMEIVPGDSVSIANEAALRVSPLVAPMMHRCDVFIHNWFVPSRILWKNWEGFITNQADPLPAFPVVKITEDNYTKLHDYFGVPTPLNGESENINAMPFAAYNKIFNDYYRDQNLIQELAWELIDGDNTNEIPMLLQDRCWEHDYFTAALPFAQKGDPVSIPLGTFENVPIKINQAVGNTLNGTPNNVVVPGDIDPTLPFNQLYAETSGVQPDSTNINDLRRAFRLQEWLEKSARGGTRLKEFIRSMFGVNTSDGRLQRAEYIGGTKTPLVISEVLNTTGTDTAPQGQMAGHGIAIAQGEYSKYYAEEHGYVISILSVMPKPAYQQGLDKFWLKTNDTFDYYYPEFAHIGEQEVLNKEVYAFQGSLGNDTFGYVPRYAEYKFMQNRVAGDFRKTLDFWHMGRIFQDPPVLSPEFVKCDPTRRIFAVTDPDIDSLYCQVLHKISAVRPMPKFGTPMF